MTRIRIKKLIWDAWNRNHIKKHSVTEREAEEVGKQVIYHRRTKRGIFLATGRSGKRLITLIIKREKRTEYYLVTARDASKKERRKIYENEKKQNSRI